MIICYDVEFPEPMRCLALAGAEIVLVPTALGIGPQDCVTPHCVLPTRACKKCLLYGKERRATALCACRAIDSSCIHALMVSSTVLIYLSCVLTSMWVIRIGIACFGSIVKALHMHCTRIPAPVTML